MKTTLEHEDIQQIAAAVMQILKPMLSGGGNSDAVLTPETLSGYLHVDISWVYKQVSRRAIPYYKNGKYVRFKRSSIDKWITEREKHPAAR